MGVKRMSVTRVLQGCYKVRDRRARRVSRKKG
jgi:hypothetical protein